MLSKLLKSQRIALRENKDFPGISSFSSFVPVFQFLLVFLISSADLLHIIY